VLGKDVGASAVGHPVELAVVEACRDHLGQPTAVEPGVQRTLHLADPDGNVVELTRPKEG
jgi:hypothetical protein